MGKLALLRRPCNQSGLKPGGSCIIQLVSGAYEILKSFDSDLEIWSVFFDISKIFVNVWQKDLVYNWKQKGILWNLLDIIINGFLHQKIRSCFNRTNLFFGPVLSQLYLKDWYLDDYYFWSTLMTSLII